ncbi:hypothetical protein ScalyP_jg765, partial [Parmales sp. scaly parma]
DGATARCQSAAKEV